MKNEVWVIKHKKTGEIWRASSGKSSWKKAGHAKTAWSNSWKYNHQVVSEYFRDQDKYECVMIEYDGRDIANNIREFISFLEGDLVLDAKDGHNNDITCNDCVAYVIYKLNNILNKGGV